MSHAVRTIELQADEIAASYRRIAVLEDLIRLMAVRSRLYRPTNHAFDCACGQCELATVYREVTGQEPQQKPKLEVIKLEAKQ